MPHYTKRKASPSWLGMCAGLTLFVLALAVRPPLSAQAQYNPSPYAPPRSQYYPAPGIPPQLPAPQIQGPQSQGPKIQGNVQQNTSGLGTYDANTQENGIENVLIILDASYSMGERLPGGESKMAAAKRVILDVLKNMPANKRVGLRIYGQSANAITACRATQLLVPLGMNNRHVLSSRLLSVRPTGATPISHAIRTSLAEDFYTTPGKKTILLISDGMETCDADPCDTAVEMIRRGIDVKINVVGFGLRDYGAAVKQMKCVAMSTFGKYYNADTAAELAKGIRESLGAHTEVQGQILTPNPTVQSSPKPGKAQVPPTKVIDVPLLEAQPGTGR